MTLTDFLLARIAEDEATARAATPGPWHWINPGPGAGTKQALVGAGGQMVLPSAWGDVYPSWMNAAHIVRWSPDRVLVACAATRQIVALHRILYTPVDIGGSEVAVCATCEDRARHDSERWPCPTLRLLALPYADHPDYLSEWKP